MSWTPERENKLKELWKKGHTASQIASMLGDTTRNAVIGKAHRLNLEARAVAKKTASNTKAENIIPNNPPITIPRIIHSKLLSVYFKIVSTIAISIPKDANLLPFLAVIGDANLFNPTMNKEAEIR